MLFDLVRYVAINPFIHNVKSWSNILKKSCPGNTDSFLSMSERDRERERETNRQTEKREREKREREERERFNLSSSNPAKCTDTLKQFVVCCLRTIWVCECVWTICQVRTWRVNNWKPLFVPAKKPPSYMFDMVLNTPLSWT